MSKNLHLKPFDEATKVKLAIFQEYLREWLPVFISAREIYWKTLNIYDFFAGPGKDVKGVKGTPSIILDELPPYHDVIISKRLDINLYFNEYDKEKYEQLTKYLLSFEDFRPYKTDTDSLDFKLAFNKKLKSLMTNDAANLLFLDQNGIKHIGEETFRQIIALKRTDFLFFISSSTIKRFCDHPNILQHINLKPSEVENTPYHQIHRLVLDYYRSLIPSNKKYYLASFSLKKGAGLYGLIFGSSHVLGIEKFLITCWKKDPERGEANFDIDNDKISPGQMDLFTGQVQRPRKVEMFEKDLTNSILNKKLETDRDVYLFTITNGFLPSHAKVVIKKLIELKKIEKAALNITSKICDAKAILTSVKLK